MKITLKKQRGLTLLELLLVVTILSATAMMATFMISDDTSQYRLKETENKLIALKKAIVNVENYNGMHAISGYVADNGKLPECIQALWDKTACTVTGAGASALNDYAAVTPRYDSSQSAGSNTVPFTGSVAGPIKTLQRLNKGFRNTYLPQIAQSGETTFRDGWGNKVADTTICATAAITDYDEKNYGWCFNKDATTEQLTITSYGRNGIKDPSPLPSNYSIYDGDSQLTIGKTEWRVDSLEVIITNDTGADYPSSVTTSSKNLRLALVSFVNGKNDWQQITANITKVNPAIIPQMPTGSSATLTITPTDGIPVGRHSLVIFNDDKTQSEKQIDIYPNINNSINWSIR